MSWLLTLPLLLHEGCALDHQATRPDDKEKADLTERSEQFWKAVQWQYSSQAAPYVEDTELRGRWTVAMDQLLEQERISEVSLQDLHLDEPVTEPADGHLRTATLLVRIEFYTLPAQVVRKATLSQRWYRSHEGWYLDWTQGDPLTGEPQNDTP